MTEEVRDRSFARESGHIVERDIPLLSALFRALGFDEQVEVTDSRG